MLSTVNNTEAIPCSKPSLRPPPFSGTALEQILQFVLPEDVARASMVCKAWRDELQPVLPNNSSNQGDGAAAPPAGVVTNSTSVWKQAVMNSHPNVMQAAIASSSSSSSSSGGGIDCHAIAKSELGRKRKIPEQLPEPTFRFDDLLIVVELKQKKRVIIQGDSENGGEEKNSSVVETVGTFWENGSADILNAIDFDLASVHVIVLEEKNPL